MMQDRRIAVVVPCYNEATQIRRVLDTMPAEVDRVYVIDDASQDDTVRIVREYLSKDPRVHLIVHEQNQGVGGSIATGYKQAVAEGMDVAVVMAGDGQMDPADFLAIVAPVLDGGYDYAKGNRLFSGEAWEMIPRVRYLGNAMLSLLTKIASGYWHIADSQSGYTAIGQRALEAIDWDQMYKRYGQPNDLLVRLNVAEMRVTDVPIRPVYGIGEKSGIRPLRMIPRLSWLIIRLFFYRMLHKYVIQDFHPLLFFYVLGILLFPPGFLFGFYLVVFRIFIGTIAETSALFAVFLTIMGLQFLLFAMLFDLENNRHLK
ncbi:glycosyltransferase family 2 protein [Thiocystis violacea]|uniref:glycosyltransferase family 2 protein n=1 Tax=Thiocystis violacea TaxID=13725 RepID=UPI0019052B63|nr:glycosyltransferase family 2 protein [Thiocystis violacea]MBK1718638.1 ribonuclease BN [Thiocystis violacea]